MRLRLLLLLPFVLLCAAMAPAQLPGPQDKVSLSARFVPEKAAPGSTVSLEVTALIEPGWHLYGSLQDPETGDPTRLTVLEAGPLVAVGEAKIPPGEAHEVFGMVTHWVEYSLDAVQEFQIPAGTAPGKIEVSGKLAYMACTELMCDPPASASFDAVLEVIAGAADPEPEPDEAVEEPLTITFPGMDFGLKKVTFDATVTPATARPGEVVTLEVTALMEPGWHIYGSLQDPEEGEPTKLFADQIGRLERLGDAVIPPGERHETLGLVGYWVEDVAVLKQSFRVPTDAEPGTFELDGRVAYMACTELMCDPTAEETWFASLTIEAGEPREQFLALPDVGAPDNVVADTVSPGSAASVEADGTGAPQLGLPGPLYDGLWALILASIGAGLFALMMPCTYPMIPITFSFFTKQADVRGGNVLPLALAYGAGIVLMFVLIGLLVGPVIVAWATHWITNLVIGVLFLAFALVLFGMINLQPPEFLANMGGRATSKGGYLGVFLMGITLVFATFTCTVPLVGALLSVTGQAGGLGQVTIGMAVFGLTMALPFVVLSLVPGKVKAMPRSGEWMHVLKVFLGFVELAAALKFLSNVDMVLQWGILPRELFLILWAGIFFVAGLFLLGIFRMQGESQVGIGPGRMVTALATVIFSFYCLFGALGYRLDYIMTTIAPPYRAATLSVAGGVAVGPGVASAEVVRGHTIIKDDHDAAVQQAIDEDKLVLINFTGFL